MASVLRRNASTFQRLLAIYPDPKTRLAMLCSKIEDSFATVFRQVVLTRFELDMHRTRQEHGELSPDHFARPLAQRQPQDVRQRHRADRRLRWWWSYIGHFIRSPSTATLRFGELLVLALIRSIAGGDKFRATLSRAGFVRRVGCPHVLLGKLGVDVNDPSSGSWGWQLLGDMWTEAEKLAGVLGERGA